MAAQLQRIQPATSLDTESSPEYVAASSAPVLRNLLPHKPGRLIQRGGLANGVAFTTNGHGPVLGPWWFGDTFIFQAPNGSDLPKIHSVTANADGTLTYNGIQAPIVDGTLLTNSWARLDDYFYGIVYDPTTLANYCIGRVQTADFASLAMDWYSPKNALDVAVFADRLFVLGGMVPDPGTGPVYNNRLYWSIAGGPKYSLVGHGALALWEDPVSGLVNQLVLPDDVGVGLAPVGSSLAIFCSNSTHVLTGSGNSNFARKQVLYRGATNRDAICAYGEGAYFLSRDGVYYFDGAQERKVSAAVESKTTQAEGVAMTGYIRNAGNDYLYVAVYDNGTERWKGLYHTKTGNWTELTFGAVVSDVQQMMSYNKHVVLLDKNHIFNASALSSPGDTLRRGVDSDPSTVYPIDTAWTTKTVRLGTPFSKAHVRRVIIDYAWMSEDAGNAWDYVLYTAPTDQGGSAPTVLASGTITDAGGGEINRRRAVIEPRAEAENLWLTLSYAGTPTASAVAELYDVWVEYDPGQQSSGY